MTAPGWLARDLSDVPAGDGWLTDRERAVLAGLRVNARRRDWRLGRWTAKAAVAATFDAPLRGIEIIAAHDGAPEAWIGGVPAPISVSLSHRGGRALAAVWSGDAIGCDIELVEPRSDAFVREWLAPREQAMIAAAAEDRARLANLFWTAKEAASKVRREGARLALRDAVVDVGDAGVSTCGWQPLTVTWAGTCSTVSGWWRDELGWMIAVAAQPAPGLPVSLRPKELTP